MHLFFQIPDKLWFGGEKLQSERPFLRFPDRFWNTEPGWKETCEGFVSFRGREVVSLARAGFVLLHFGNSWGSLLARGFWWSPPQGFPALPIPSWCWGHFGPVLGEAHFGASVPLGADWRVRGRGCSQLLFLMWFSFPFLCALNSETECYWALKWCYCKSMLYFLTLSSTDRKEPYLLNKTLSRDCEDHSVPNKAADFFVWLRWRWFQMEKGPLSHGGVVRTTARGECEVLRYFVGLSDVRPKVTTFKVTLLQTDRSHCFCYIGLISFSI